MRRETLHDHYFLKAKKENFSARSVYKLKDIQEKYKILKPGFKVLDLGASPGSWSEYIADVLKETPSRSAPSHGLVSLDLQPLSARALERIKRTGISFQYLQASIFDGNSLPDESYDTVVSDMAPATQGSRIVDCAASLELNLAAWQLAQSYLKKGGNFVTKVFQSEDNFATVKTWHRFFRQSKLYRPPAVRKESKEIYFVGLGFGEA